MKEECTPPVPSQRTADDFPIGLSVYFCRAISEKGEVIGVWGEVVETTDTCVTITYCEHDELTGEHVGRQFSCIFRYAWLLLHKDLYWLEYDETYPTEWLEDCKSSSSKFDQEKFLEATGLQMPAARFVSAA